jgi:hypothetical protein
MLAIFTQNKGVCMKRISIFVLLFSFTVFAADTVSSSPNYIYFKQKDACLAALSGVLVPGGANIYSERYISGAAFALIEILGIVTFFIGTDTYDNTSAIGGSIWAAGFLSDIYTGMIFSNNYNKKHFNSTMSLNNTNHFNKYNNLTLFSVAF